jgi:hypothetical protein
VILACARAIVVLQIPDTQRRLLALSLTTLGRAVYIARAVEFGPDAKPRAVTADITTTARANTASHLVFISGSTLTRPA